MVLVNLATELKKKRTELHLTQRELASTLGVTLRTVQAWEAGTATPQQGEHRRALSAFLGEAEGAAA